MTEALNMPDTPAEPDPLPGMLRRATQYQRHAISAAVGVPVTHVLMWSRREHLYDLAPWVRRRIADHLTATTTHSGRRQR